MLYSPPPLPLRRPRLKKRLRAFSLVEVLLAMMLFTLMTLMFAAVFPIAARSARASSQYAQATLIAQHKVDQLRAAGFNNLAWANLVSLGIIDPANAPPAATGPWVYTFTAVDHLTDAANGAKGFFPSGATGTLTLQADPYAPLDPNAPANPVFQPGSSVVRATITISWKNTTYAPESYSTTCLLIQMSHQ